MKLVYICHEFGGKEENREKVERIVRGYTELDEFKDVCFLVPHSATGFLYNSITWKRGMKHCIELLSRCDEMWVFGEYSMSKGCVQEKEYCKDNDIPVIDKLRCR